MWHTRGWHAGCGPPEPKLVKKKIRALRHAENPDIYAKRWRGPPSCFERPRPEEQQLAWSTERGCLMRAKDFSGHVTREELSRRVVQVVKVAGLILLVSRIVPDRGNASAMLLAENIFLREIAEDIQPLIMLDASPPQTTEYIRASLEAFHCLGHRICSQQAIDIELG